MSMEFPFCKRLQIICYSLSTRAMIFALFLRQRKRESIFLCTQAVDTTKTFSSQLEWRAQKKEGSRNDWWICQCYSMLFIRMPHSFKVLRLNLMLLFLPKKKFRLSAIYHHRVYFHFGLVERCFNVIEFCPIRVEITFVADLIWRPTSMMFKLCGMRKKGNPTIKNSHV